MTQAEFVVSAISQSDFPHQGIPEVVFAGRSNVGKSSLINSLTGHKGLARTSSAPGKTQSVNFYRVNRSFFFVDLPGYGYAKAGKLASARWKKLIDQYFRGRGTIVLAVELVDSRMPPTESDLQLSGWLQRMGLARMIVATKSDKLSSQEKTRQQQIISEAFGGEPVLMSSAETGAGMKEIWRRVQLATAGREVIG